MNEFQIHVMARMSAIEHVLVHIGKIACLSAGLEPDHMKEMLRIESLKRDSETFPGADPALSDHLSDEIGASVKRLLGHIAADVETAYAKARGEE